MAAIAFAPAAGGVRRGVATAAAVARTELRRFADIDAALAWAEQGPEPTPMTVDIPIGLPVIAGLRACDREARVRLGRRWMCVFEAPGRELFGQDFASARELVRARRDAAPRQTLHIPTHQMVNITPKVAEVDRALRARPGRQQWLAECHPELSFRVLAGRELLGKRAAEGRAQRRAALAGPFPDAAQRLDAVSWRRSEVTRDDLLDAYAALWSALRFAAADGRYLQLGDGGRDARGLLQRIVV